MTAGGVSERAHSNEPFGSPAEVQSLKSLPVNVSSDQSRPVFMCDEDVEHEAYSVW